MADRSRYVEYIALYKASYKTIFLCQLLKGLSFLSKRPIPLLCNNNAAFYFAKDQTGHLFIKYIQMKFHSICALIEEESLWVTHVHSTDNTADIFIKSLG